MRNLSDLRLNEGGQPVMRPPPEPSAISMFEKEFSVKIPNEIREFLGFSNGGHPELDSIIRGDEVFSISRFYHLSLDDKGSESLWFAMKHWHSVIGENGFVFARDGGNNQFFLDMTVFPCQVRYYSNRLGENVFLCESFSKFIDELTVDLDAI